jgi:hypothetical protein
MLLFTLLPVIDSGTHTPTSSFPSFRSGSSEAPIFKYIHISAVSTHFLLAAAAVHCTCSGDHRGRVLRSISTSTRPSSARVPASLDHRGRVLHLQTSYTISFHRSTPAESCCVSVERTISEIGGRAKGRHMTLEQQSVRQGRTA